MATALQRDAKKLDRISIYITIGIGFVVIFGGVLQVRAHLYVHERTTFASYYEKIAQGDSSGATGLFNESASQVFTGEEDSDGDGLTDSQESTVYNTSIYLSDTDSDGVSDGDEVAQGTDPNCPEGDECATPTDTSEVTTDASGEFSSLNPNDVELSDDVDPDQLREVLLASGVSQNDLDQLSDEEVITLYKELVTQQQKADGVTNAQDYAESINNLSPAEKKQLLIESGVSEDEVNALSDDQLDELFTQLINEVLEEEGLNTLNDSDSEKANESPQ